LWAGVVSSWGAAGAADLCGLPVPVPGIVGPLEGGPVSAPYWTVADQAELDALTWTLISDYFQHRPCCETCEAGYPPCPQLQAAIGAVLDWREARLWLSLARYLREAVG
jgi:hypothetical protein